ncbi:immunoglobulin-like and fibronectin type III domain-containing protein 1 isoform X22 [Sphaerodactylus townsendi]|uniref:immunoglobulin-like and fibronectin type III domain-containing protein 1 isoform X22 n=1 Tax=Sphaerodactylus townsendi TaxID=933632 RepID=UPI002025D167|nr:immunoglobulin-like and fibronectin type III domain-containing protein 1 isoform X22 [Sphaerodactylus townsendi]
MAGQRRVQSVKKSSVPGVTITQFVEDIPKGCSTPDFERKPITLTLQEGKNAIFRAVVKGEPKPEVVWKRNNTSIDDPQKYQITFSPASNEFILQINKITADDADLYRCTAVNEYGEATCTAGLKIIQVGFKKKTKEASSARQGDLKKEIQDFRKTLKKRAPSVLPKKELDSEQVWQLLLHADKKDYERICLKYGIVDFRGMLRKLQEMKKEREDKQAQYISSITNLKHVRVNEEKGNASFDLEMELKNPESRIYLYKDGQMIHFGFDSDNAKHCLRKVGRKYNFIINNVQPEDAGVYQIKVEDVDIFSTELEEETIPMSFRNPLGDVRCHEQGNAVFQCTLYDACFDAVWLHKNCRLQPSDKYDISVSDDGLTHRLLIKNTELSDKGTYTIDVGSRSSSAWLEIESAKGKRKQAESDSDKAGWKNKLLEDGAKKLRQGEGHEDQDSHSDFSMGKDGQYRDGQDGSGEFHGFLGKDGSLEREGKMGQFSGIRGNMAEGNQFSGFAGDSSGVMGFDQNSMLHGSGVSGGPGGLVSMGALTGKDNMLGGIPSDTVFGTVGGLHAVQGQGSMLNGASIGGSAGGTDLEGFNYNKGVLHGPGVMLGDVGGLHDKDVAAGLYGKDGVLSGVGGGGIEGIAGLHGQTGLLHGAGAGGPGGPGGIAGLYGKDGMLGGAGAGGPGGAGGVAGLYGKEGMLGGAGAGGPGGAGGVAGLYGKDGMLIGAGAGGPGGAGGIAGLYGKDGTLNGAGAGGPGGAGGEAGLYGKDGMLGGAGAGGPGGAGGIAGLYGKDGMLGGAGAGGAGGGVGLYGKDGTLGGVGAGGPGGAGGIAGLYGKDGLLGGAGAGGPGGAGGGVGLYGKDGTLGGVGAGGPGGAGGRAGLSGKDGMLDGEGAGGTGGAGGMAGLYGKDGMLGGAGAGGPGGAGGVAGLYGKDGMLIGAGAGGPGGAGGVAGLYGKDGTLGEVGAGGPGGAGGRAGLYGKDGMVGGAGAGGPGGAGGVAGLYGKDGALGGVGSGGAGGAGGVAGLYGKDGTLIGPGAGGPGRAGGVAGLYGKDGMPGGIGVGGPGDAGIAGGLHCKDGMLPGTDHFGDSGAGDMQGLYTKNGMQSSAGFDGAGNISGLHGKDGRPAGAGIVGFGEGVIGDPYGMEGRLGGIGAGVSGIDWSLSGVPGEDFQNYNQLSGVQAGDRRRQLSDTDASGLISADISRTRDRKGRGGSLLEEDMREPHCRFTEGLFDIHAEKGKSAVLSCSLNNDQLEGTWLKDGFEVTGLEGISVEKNGAIHKLIIDEVQDNHAGKYKFETEGIHTEASLFVEEPPNVDASVLEKLQKEPVVVKAGKNAMVKIPFEGKKPIRASWLKDDGELLDDARIHTDHSDNFTRLSISSTNRKDCGDYKVKLKNDSGSLEATLKLVVLDKPQPPVGPIEVVDTSTSGITIQWKPPKDDGGKPVQRYIIERQQVGRKTWLTLGETNGNSTIFTTSKVEHDKSYYFKVKAVNAEGTSEALESEEVMAATKVFPGPPAPPKIVSANKDAITLSWGPPHKAGNSRISGYIVEKCKKGSNTWTPVSNLPITDKKYTVTDLKEGLQYEFRVAAINAAGAGEASVPSEAVFAREPMKPPGPVRELKVVSTDYTSISLSWKKPESEEESHAKGYIIEMRHSDILKWTQCNALPITTTSYTVRKLKPKEMYFLRVKAVNDGGSSDPVELDTYIQAVPPSVYPKLLINDTMKSFMIVKAGDTIRVRVPFEASPTPEVIWLRDGLSLPYKATIATREGLTQVIIPGAEYSDSGLYTITLQTESGKKETFSFLVQVIDIPESPGPIQLVEKVPDTVTLIWEHSPTEKRGHNLYYMVMKRDTSKGSWELVSDLIYTNKCTVSNFIPGREYYFRVLAKNFMGISDPSETVQPWSVNKAKGKFEVRLPRYKGVNQSQPPRFLVQLKPHIVTLGFDCHMSCAVTGYPVPQVTWYKDGKNLSQDPSFVTKNDFGVCSLVIPGVTPSDEGEFKVVASNALGQAVSRATVTIKASAL